MENQLKENPPYSVAVLALGICSIVVSSFGIVCGIIALVLANKGFEQYKLAPELYKSSQFLKAGKICAIIGVSLRGFLIVFAIFIAILYGTIEGFSHIFYHFDGQTLRDFLHQVVDNIE
ncbi:MAG: hypothetical protein LBO06_02570 [Bacteroidales bacterium]|jgi:hypothetical protein|nr:hypothetical protein [Bacteroidales bacterium]